MTREQWIMLLETPAIPKPAPMFAPTMPNEVKMPTQNGPITSVRGSSWMDMGERTNSTIRQIIPIKPHAKRNPKPILKVS